MNPEQLAAYLASKGLKCPFCEDGAVISDGRVDFPTGAHIAHQDAHCTNCGKRWVDEYTLSGVRFVA